MRGGVQVRGGCLGPSKHGGAALRFLDLSLPTPEENLALDEALLITAESEGQAEFLRVWQSHSYFVVLGKNCSEDDDVWRENCRADGVAVARRVSGGGTVLIGPGCLNFAVVLRYDRAVGLDDITASHRYVLDRVRHALEPLAAGIEQAGTSDLARGERKFCGNAQRRQRTHFLHHGSILVDFDLARIARCLREPRRQPDYRAGRDHLGFLRNIGGDPSKMRERLRAAWAACEPAGAWPEPLVRQLVRDKYTDPAWTQRGFTIRRPGG